MANPATAEHYRFTCGPWNISTGSDPFGPPVRDEVAFAEKLRLIKAAGMTGVQFHDDDVVPAELSWQATQEGAAKVKKLLDGEGLFCEFIAPRLWEHPHTIDGAFTANDPAMRRYALERSKRSIDIANLVGDRIVKQALDLKLAKQSSIKRIAGVPFLMIYKFQHR